MSSYMKSAKTRSAILIDFLSLRLEGRLKRIDGWKQTVAEAKTEGAIDGWGLAEAETEGGRKEGSW